jgi:hypothetical protein
VNSKRVRVYCSVGRQKGGGERGGKWEGGRGEGSGNRKSGKWKTRERVVRGDIKGIQKERGKSIGSKTWGKEESATRGEK